MNSESEYSPKFYKEHAQRYARISHEFLQSVYIRSTHPGLKSDLDLIEGLKKLIAPGALGLDAGCGAGARDVFFYWKDGYSIVGVDAIEENILAARSMHPEIARQVSVCDLAEPLGYTDAHFDFVICNAVIQHIDPVIVKTVTLPEFVRVMKPAGVLQLMFKSGTGVTTIYDKDYNTDRTFQLYEVDEIVNVLVDLGMEIISAEGDGLGGIMFFTDPKPMEHCVFYARKVN